MGTKVTLLELFCLLEAKRNEGGVGTSGIYGFIASINVGNPPRWWKSPTTERDHFQTKKNGNKTYGLKIIRVEKRFEPERL